MGGGALVVAAPVALIATCLSAITLIRARDEVSGIPGWAVFLTVGLLTVAVAGCVLIASSRQRAFSAAVLGATALAVFGLLAIFSVGLLALLLAGVLLVRIASHGWPAAGQRRAALGAVLSGAPLPVLLVFALQQPIVDCDTDGVTTRSNVFMAIRSHGGTAESSNGTESGSDRTYSERVVGEGYEYSFTCDDGRLARFDLRWR